MMPVDLNELDRLRAAATQGTWATDTPDETSGDSIICGPYWVAKCYRAASTVGTEQTNRNLIVALVNAYPAIAAELRELREKVAELTAMNMGLEQMLDEAEPIMQTRGPK